MKRSVEQEHPSQGTSSKMARPRHDLEDVEVTSPTTNIFLVETVLRRLFKQIESVAVLKELRRMCQLWDRVGTDELEEKAFKGLFKPIDLTFSHVVYGQFQPLKASSVEMRRFLDDTSSNPRLFRSFTIAFPGSLALLNLYKFRWFYKDFSPTFLELAISYDFRFNQDKEGLLKELFRWAASTLRQLVFTNNSAPIIPTRKSLPVNSFIFPCLKKVSMKNLFFGETNVVEAFKIIFTKENHPETPSLASLSLRCVYPTGLQDLISNPTRWATLTMLEIKCDYNGHLNKLTNGLLPLAQAGITLKKLYLDLISDWDGDFIGFQHWSQFFASQAGSLEALKLFFYLKLNVTIEENQERQVKIILPVFERLHTLSLELDTIVYTNDIFTSNDVIEFGSILHFPALENLSINFGFSMHAFFGTFYEVQERINLKRLAIPYGIYRGNDVDFGKTFRSVEAFSCSQYALHDLGMLGDLVDTIRVLHIREVNSELDLSQFKGLRRVVIEEDEKTNRSNWELIGKKRKLEVKGCYLGIFKKVAELGLDSIKFRGLEIVGEEHKKIAETFPFRVEFEEKPADWDEKDFMNI